MNGQRERSDSQNTEGFISLRNVSLREYSQIVPVRLLVTICPLLEVDLVNNFCYYVTTMSDYKPSPFTSFLYRLIN